MKKEVLKSMPAKQVTLFKIANRRGYAALCKNNLTEGNTPLQAYDRMIKAVKRMGYALPELSAGEATKLVLKNI